MEEMLSGNPATKRLIVGFLGAAAAALANKYGISENVSLAIVGLAATMITGSNWKEAKVAGAEAAKAVGTPAEAIAIFKGPVAP